MARELSVGHAEGRGASGRIAYSNDNTNDLTALCLEINDLWLTKLTAGRPNDFCRVLVRASMITPDIVRARAPTIYATELAARVERRLSDTGQP